MQKLVGFAAWFTIGTVAVVGGTFNNIGSVSWPCVIAAGGGAVVEHATGTNFNFPCPPGTVLPGSGSASVGDLSAQADIHIGSVPSPMFSLQSTFTESLLPIGGTGSGTVEFTLTYSFSGLVDLGGAQGIADLFFNGVQAASIHPQFCSEPVGSQPCFQFNPQTVVQVVVQVIDEPITYGVPFSYQVDDVLSGGGMTLFSLSNRLTVSTSLTSGGELAEVPEPGTAWLGVIGLIALLLRTKLYHTAG